MNKPANQVSVYVVVAPGGDPLAVQVVPNLVKLGWKFGDMTSAVLIDTVKRVDDYLKALEKWVAAAREALKSKLPEPVKAGEETVTRGVLFEAHYIKSSRMDIDREKVKAHFGDRYPEFCKTTEILTLKIVPVTQTPGAAS